MAFAATEDGRYTHVDVWQVFLEVRQLLADERARRSKP